MRLFALCSLLFAASSAFAADPPPVGNFKVEGPSRAELLQTVRHIETLAGQLQSDLDNEKAAHASAAAALTSAQGNLKDATAKNLELQKAIDIQADQLNKAIVQLAHVLKKLHLAKIIVSAVASALVIFVVLKLGIPPPFMFYVMGAAIAAVNAAVWIFL